MQGGGYPRGKKLRKCKVVAFFYFRYYDQASIGVSIGFSFWLFYYFVSCLIIVPRTHTIYIYSTSYDI